MLVAFPENYRLYEHVKKTEKDGKTEVKNKTHAAGGNERQDAYLYGHPIGRKKRYRSPADFFPHLLWLSTDETGDPGNCGCKICSPEDLAEPVTAKVRVKQESDSKAASQPAGVVARQPSGSVPTKPQAPLSAPSPAPKATTPAARTLVPTPLKPPRTTDQHVDRQYNTFMYRGGELVWFQRGQAWGLGVVLRRWMNSTNQHHYTVQPLSHPFAHSPQITKSSDAELRPWLAWSVPKYTNEALNNMKEPLTYDTADWSGMMQGRYGNGDLEVDGSILAAKSIDSSYVLVGPNKPVERQPGVFETYCDGIFLGAEKAWVGDPLRLQTIGSTDILVLHSVVHRSATLDPSGARQSVSLIGDVYKLQTVRHTDQSISTPASPSNNPQLPERLTQDITYRNSRSIGVKGIASYWQLITIKKIVGLNDIKGRWYEATLLLPILQRSMFDDAARKGEIQEASLWMNARGDCLNSNRPSSLPRLPRQNIRKESRVACFIQAVPPSAEVKEGIDPPLPDNVDPALGSGSMEIDPRFETAEDHGHGHEALHSGRSGHAGAADPGASGLDEFMNLDGMEENQSAMPGFGKEYGGQDGGQRSYY